MKRLSKQLIEKSQQAFVLSLEIYNKPTIQYRIESFCFFFINAWELLLKAKILEDTKKDTAIFYRKPRGKERKSISLIDALRKMIQNEKNPVRRNIEDIQNIRDSATHLIVDELDSIYSGLFQSGVLNYTKKLNEWFNIKLTDKISPAMLSLVFDIKQIDPIVIERKYGKEVLRFIVKQEEMLNRNQRELSNNIAYRIPIEYKLVLTKRSKDTDITLPLGKEGIRAIIIESPKDIDKTHPYRSKELCEETCKCIGREFSPYDIQSILYKEKIKKENNKYHYCVKKLNYHLYSKELVNFIANKIAKDPGYIQKCRNAYRNFLRKRRVRTRSV